MNKIYFISDTHFHHKNIINYSSRPFEFSDKGVEDMNNLLIERWNSVVGKDDVVYFLGDLAFGSNIRGTYEYLSKTLNGNIKFVKGNHDRSVTMIERYFEYVEHGIIVEIDTFRFILTHKPLPYDQIPKGCINIHGHIHDRVLKEDVRDHRDPNAFIHYGRGCHVNVSVEVNNYTPLFVLSIVEDINKGVLKPKGE